PTPCSELRQPDPGGSHIPPQPHELRQLLRRLNPLEPFNAHALRRELRQALCVRLRRLECASVDPKLKARAESKRAQNPQIILLEPPIGVADRADKLLGEILFPLKRVP